MNFFTTNSRRQRQFPIALLVAICLLGVLDVALTVYVYGKTSRDRFIDSKDSKFMHLSRQGGKRPYDVIFVGSSFTKNHVSTSAFADHGLHIYNLGISGRLLADFPSMVEAAIGSGTKLIVLSVSVDELFAPPRSNFVHATDLRMLISSSSSVKSMADHISAFLLSQHTLHYHRESIYQQLRGTLVRLIPAQKNSGGVAKTASDTIVNIEEQKLIEIDCQVFKTETHEKIKVLTCTNGDGIQLGYLDHTADYVKSHYMASNETVHFEASQMNLDSLALLNSVIGLGRDKAKVIVVLQPIWGRDIYFDIEAFQKKIQAPVIDLTAATFSDRDWCDSAHFNIFGRKKYSSLLKDNLSFYYSGIR